MQHVVALSGGKDSTAMALRLAEVEPRDYDFVITPTGDELPDMIEHWRTLGVLLGKPLRVVSSGVSLDGLIDRQHAIPNHRMRWCTRLLKIEPFLAYMLDVAPATAYVGLRADEPSDVRQGAVYGSVAGVVAALPAPGVGVEAARRLELPGAARRVHPTQDGLRGSAFFSACRSGGRSGSTTRKRTRRPSSRKPTPGIHSARMAATPGRRASRSCARGLRRARFRGARVSLTCSAAGSTCAGRVASDDLHRHPEDGTAGA